MKTEIHTKTQCTIKNLKLERQGITFVFESMIHIHARFKTYRDHLKRKRRSWKLEEIYDQKIGSWRMKVWAINKQAQDVMHFNHISSSTARVQVLKHIPR
jgi:hypothetical protein